MTEEHPLFPSGNWQGFYTYASGPQARKCNMPSVLSFLGGSVSGGGSDNVGSFVWSGTYNSTSLICQLTKSYLTHDVQYQGHVDENGIWGTWNIDDLKGGFHLWPQENERILEESVVEELVNG